MLTHFFFVVAVHCAPNLFDLMKEDKSMHLHSQVQALIISKKNILEQLMSTLGEGQRSPICDDPLSCEFVLYYFHHYLTFAGSLHKKWERDITSKVSNLSFANFD